MTEPPLTQLGQTVQTPPQPKDAAMECVPNPHPGTHYVTRYTYPQSTCVCPVTGQLNFAHLVINYISGQWLVESKSLKFYL